MSETVRFRVNGKAVTSSKGEQRLIDFIRDDLGLTGTKDGCSVGRCGACTILVDGVPKRACRMTCSQAEGKDITTIEGIGTPDDPHPLQRAFVETGAVQCGFCTPGMILSAKALLDKDPDPGDEVIKKALMANLCRCTGYTSIIEAVKLAAAYMRGEEREVSACNSSLIGAPVNRHDAMDKACGISKYASDITMKGTLYAVPVRSPHASARIVSVDKGPAMKIDGVKDVFTAEDVPGELYIHGFKDDQPAMAHGVVRQPGEVIAVVTASTMEQAEAGAKNVKVEYEILPDITDAQKALHSEYRIHPEGNICMEYSQVHSDEYNAARGACIYKTAGTFRTQRVEHAYLEPEAATAFIDENGVLTLFGPTQAPHLHAAQMAAFLGLPKEKVRMQQSVIGGGFGSREDLTLHCWLALAALRTGQPVKTVFSREDCFLTTVKRHPYTIEAELTGSQNGAVQSVKMDLVSDTGAYANAGPPVLIRSVYHAPGPYAVPSMDVHGTLVYSNNPSGSAMRGFGVPQVTFAMESLLSDYAELCGIDELELRRMNALRPGLYTAFGQKATGDVALVECIDAIKEDYLEMKAGCVSEGDIKRGVGVSCCWYGTGGTNISNYAESRVELDTDGVITVYAGTTEIGQGANIIFAQIAGELLSQSSVEKVFVVTGDSATCPPADVTSASRQTYISGNALYMACSDLKRKIQEKAAAYLGCAVDEIELTDGGVIGEGDKRAAFEDFVDEKLIGKGSFDPEPGKLKSGGKGPYRVFSFAALAVQVAVNTKSGTITVEKMRSAFDCGRIMNLKSAEGQIHGGLIMGLGYALMEDYRTGITVNYNNYKIPNSTHCCSIKNSFVKSNAEDSYIGAKGMGEIPLIPVAAAVANAVKNAIGVRFYDLPITKEKVLANIG